MHKSFIHVTLLVTLFLFTGCSGKQGFRPENLAKRDLDFVADAHLQQIDTHLKTLMKKLYLRNPRELKKEPDATIESRSELIFSLPPPYIFDELGGKESIDAMLLALDAKYRGDRVFALMVGLSGMLHNAYDNKSEFFILDSLDQQKLYDSARNIEVLIWRLKTRTDQNDQPLLITFQSNSTSDNLSFERLFGKMIALQDSLALIVSQKTDRTINLFVHGLATSFLPI